VGLVPPALEMQGMALVILGDADLVGRQVGDEIGQQPGRNGNRPLLLDQAIEPVGNADLKIGGL